MNLKVLFLFVLALCLSQVSLAQEVKITADASRGYQVGPGDVITIKVIGEPEFNVNEISVDEDGRIQLPFSDQGISAQCRTEKEITADVKRLLSKYLRNPQASVYVSKRNSRPPVTIYGEVRAQQQVVLTRKASLLDILASAGGVTEKAGGMIQVFRTQKPICVQLSEENDWSADSSGDLDIPSRLYSVSSLKTGNKESNPEVFPGDIVVVQEAMPVFVVGEVNSTGKVLLPEGGLPLTQAIASVGGFSREAKQKDIKVYRLKTNSKERETLVANYDLIKQGKQKDIMLQPYDIVEVNKSKKSVFEVMLDIATGGLQNAANVLPVRVL
jgi:polysaccharide export outer membrane protein